MTDVPAYDDQNIFAKILRGEMGCHRVYEDEVVLAFMDIMPQVAGHTLVLPKAASRNLLDASPDTLVAVMPRLQRIGAAVVAAMQADGLTLMQCNEAAGGQSVFHLHFHLLPRHDGAAMKPPGTALDKPEVLADHAARIRARLAG